MGSHVAEHLFSAGHHVVVLDDLSGGFAENVPVGAEFVEGSVLNHELIDYLFDWHRFDCVFHLAAYAAEGLSHFIKRFNYTNNLIGTVNLINASVNYDVKHFVSTSSIAVYGAGQVPMTEDMIPEPEDSYGIAKLACEQELRATQQMFGLNYTIFRPHNVYGERQNIGDRYRNVVGIFMNQIMKGEPMTIFGDGEQQRAFTHISDVAPLIAQCVELSQARNETFNVGADVPCTVNELAKFVADAMGVELRVEHLPPRNEVRLAFCSHGKAEQVFGHSNRVSMEEGIRRMAAWAKLHGPRESSRFADIEIPRNLPPSWAQEPDGRMFAPPIDGEALLAFPISQ
jgi:UDP-glucose 4-epimerase